MITLPVKTPDGVGIVDIRRPNTNSVLQAKAKANDNKFFRANLELLKDSIIIDGKPMGEDAKKIPWVSCEVLALETFSKLAYSTKLAFNSLHDDCGHINVLSKTKNADNRIDLKTLKPKNFSGTYEESFFKLVPFKNITDYIQKEEGETEAEFKQRCTSLRIIRTKLDGGKEEVLIVKSITFRTPLLEDMMICSETTKDDQSFQNKLFNSLIVDMDFEYHGDAEIETFEDALNKFRLDGGGILNFEISQYYEQIPLGLHKYGIPPFVKIPSCGGCQEEYEDYYSFMSFFVSALRSSLR